MEQDLPSELEKHIVFKEYGNPRNVLELETRPVDSTPLTPGNVRVRILAAPLNPADLNTVEGTYGVKPPLPATPGIEGCGLIESSGCTDFEKGGLVIFLRRASTWATHTTVPSSTLIKLPPGIDPLQAAMLKVNPATAWRLLHTTGVPKKGSWIVQNAGNSAVGQCVIQLAKNLGIQTISFVRREELIPSLLALGAEHVFLDDDAGVSLAKEVMEGADASLAFNAVGGDSALRLMKLLKEGGTHVTYGAMGRRPVSVPNGLLIFRDIRIQGLWVTRWVDEAPEEEVREVYQYLAEQVADGKLLQPVDSTYPLESYQEALARLDEPNRIGKVLFVP